MLFYHLLVFIVNSLNLAVACCLKCRNASHRCRKCISRYASTVKHEQKHTTFGCNYTWIYSLSVLKLSIKTSNNLWYYMHSFLLRHQLAKPKSHQHVLHEIFLQLYNHVVFSTNYAACMNFTETVFHISKFYCLWVFFRLFAYFSFTCRHTYIEI